MDSLAAGKAVPYCADFMNSSRQAVLLVQRQCIQACNAAAARLFGACHGQLLAWHYPLQLSPPLQPCGQDSADKAGQLFGAQGLQGSGLAYWQHQRLDGTLFYARVSWSAVGAAGSALVQVVVQDLTDCLRQSLDAAIGQLIFGQSNDALMVTDRQNRIIDVNPAFCRITGYPRDEVLGQPAGFMRSGRHDQEFYQRMWQQLNDHGRWQGEIWDKHRQGHLFPKDLRICVLPGPDGEVMHYLALFSDISEKIQHKLALEKLAYYDTLTGLPNRALLLDTLERTLSQLDLQQAAPQLALAFIDIDNFKAINDTRGHQFGDLLIKAVTRRIQGLIGADDFLGRMSGDEFLLIFAPQRALADIEQQISGILNALRQPLQLDDICQPVHLSIGISVCPQDGTDSKSLIARADIAMYHAKKSGGSHYRFYSAEVGARFFEKTDIELQLADALRSGAVFPEFQPKIDLHQGAVVGGEILARWRRADGVRIPPDKFIPVAEQQHLIRPLSDLLVRQSAALMQQQPVSATLALNISVKELLQPQFSQQFISSLHEAGLSPHHCEIEITESCLIENFGQAKCCIDELRAQGVKVAIDDFGTGFCSLNYLRSLSVDTIKLDRSFIAELTSQNHNNLIVVKAIIDLAHRLGIKVLAEGVETQEQLLLLKVLQCDEAQGFYFSPALSWPQFACFASQDDVTGLSQLAQPPLPAALAAFMQPAETQPE